MSGRFKISAAFLCSLFVIAFVTGYIGGGETEATTPWNSPPPSTTDISIVLDSPSGVVNYDGSDGSADEVFFRAEFNSGNDAQSTAFNNNGEPSQKSDWTFTSWEDQDKNGWNWQDTVQELQKKLDVSQFNLGVNRFYFWGNTSAGAAQVSGTFCLNDTSDNKMSCTPTYPCSSTSDSDKDGLYGSDDPGCVKPFHRETSEGNAYDLDMSYLFANNGGNDGKPGSSNYLSESAFDSGPSIFTGSEAFYNNNGANIVDDKEDDGNPPWYINESFIQDMRSSQHGMYGYGILSFADIDNSSIGSDANIVFDNSKAEIRDAPRDGQCGDGKQNDADGDSNYKGTLECPEDYGLPDDEGNSEKSISEAAFNWGPSGIGDAGDETEDEISFKADLSATEFRADDPSSINIRGKTLSDVENDVASEDELGLSDNRVRFQDKNDWAGVPDFYMTSSQSKNIRALYTEINGLKDIGDVSTTYLKDKTTKDEYEGGEDTDFAYSCESSDGGCQSTNFFVPRCLKSDVTSDTLNGYKLTDSDKDKVVVEFSSDSFSSFKDGTEIKPSKTSTTHSLDVKVYSSATSESIDYKKCTGNTYTTEYSCEDGKTCTIQTADAIRGSGTVSTYKNTDTKSVDLKFQDIDTDTTIAFSTDPDVTKADAEQGLFGGDSLSVDSSGTDGGIWGPSVGSDSFSQGNDPSVSYSKFEVFIDGNQFKSRRTSWDTYDADGSNGQGDGFVALKDRGSTLAGKDSNTLERERTKDGVTDYLQWSDQVGSGIDCPNNHNRCVASIDVSIKPISSWNTINADTNTKVETVTGNPFALDESYSACKFYNKVSSNDVQCTYENTADGKGPLPYGTPDDDPGEWWHTMTGPAVDNTQSRMSNYPIIYEGRLVASGASDPGDGRDWNKVGKKGCIFNGSAYAEGTLKDIGVPIKIEKNPSGEDRYETFEKGGWSQDKEVCLNVDGSDVGSEWYDLDDKDINSYLDGKSLGVKSNGGDQQLWLDENPDKNALSSTGVIKGGGIPIEDDCAGNLQCSDTGGSTPVYANFTEGARDDDYAWDPWPSDKPGSYTKQNLKGVHNTVQADSDQDTEGVSLASQPLENSRIDPEDDEWAMTPGLDWAIGNDGTGYKPFGCRGTSRQQGTDLGKDQRAYANSYILTRNEYSGGESGGKRDGVWVDPDNTSYSAVSGRLTCDLTGKDWGYGYRTDSDTLTNQGSRSLTAEGYDSNNPYVVTGPINFDEGNNPDSKEAEFDKNQWKSACGDDPNEYLIREHEAQSGTEDEHSPDISGEDIFVCADRPTDCAYNGQAYTQGNTIDIGASDPDSEKGDHVKDSEVCIDADPSIPGGEWYDLDADVLIESSLALTDSQINRIKQFSGSYWGSNPGTDRSKAPTGYATEDDCDPDLGGFCDDAGTDLSGQRWFNAGNFSKVPSDPDRQEGARQDNYPGTDTETFLGVHNRIQDRSDQYESGAATEELWTSGAYPEPRTYINSKPGPDNWTLSNVITDSVGKNGTSYTTGGCYYYDSSLKRGSILSSSREKDQKVFGNSYANASDYDNDGEQEGVWIDPDSIESASNMNFTCDLTGPDKGYGLNNASNPDEWVFKNTWSKTSNGDSKVVIGDIAFASEGYAADYTQEPDVCGDDQKEFLLEGLGEAPGSEHQEGRWACATEWDKCIARSSSGKDFYDPSSYADTRETGELFGRSKNDKEICRLVDTDDYGQRGVWFDQDLEANICRQNTLYGSEGVRWIEPDYINNYPNAVAGGIDDDMNPLMGERRSEFFTSTNGDVESYESKPEDEATPVPTGKNVSDGIGPGDLYQETVVSKGFCAGDDSAEYLVTQDCNARLCETDRSVIGVAGSADSCVMDGEGDNFLYKGSKMNERKLFEEGESLQVDLGSSKKEIACFDGNWYQDWPIVFERENITVEKGETRKATFGIINVDTEEQSFEVDLQETEVSRFTEFSSKSGDSFTTTVQPRSSKQFQVEIYGGDTGIGTEDNFAPLRVQAVSEEGVSGEDSIGVNIVENRVTGGGVQTSEPKNVPGIGAVQLLVAVLLSSLVFFTQS